MNAILVARTGSTEHRRVRRSVYAGQGKLDLETYLAQPDPDQLREDPTLRADTAARAADLCSLFSL